MIKLIPLKDKELWNSFVKTFNSFDTYYTAEYLEPFSKIERAEIFLLTFQKDNFRLCYPILIKDIAHDIKFSNKLPPKEFYDIETPYGYGGPIVRNYSKENMTTFFEELQQWAIENNIVAQFYRFHPLIENHKYCEDFTDLATFKQTVHIDLQDEETIYKNMNDKCRNMVKKATKNGVEIRIDNSSSAQEKFIELYNATMNRNNATDYYFFNNDFFTILFSYLGKNCNLFNAIYENQTISSAIIFEENDALHYHLSAANREYMKLAGNNLLLYEVAKYGSIKGYKSFHLGGGVEAEDGLFIFKKSFNKNGLKDFYIGRNIFNKEKYKHLMKIRQSLDENFDINNKRMIGYRA